MPDLAASLPVDTLRIPPLGLEALLAVPASAIGVVVFAHGSGSSRFSPRNTHVANALHQRGLGTLLFDLLLDEEAQDRANVFDIELLATRLAMASHWLCGVQKTRGLPIGYFGSSTGAAAALLAAVRGDQKIAAIVSRGGRPDLAGDALAQVRAPTLLIVGGHDIEVLALNEQALALLDCPKRLSVVPGATHLFEERGTLDQVVALAGDWFETHLGAAVGESAATLDA